MGSKSAINDLLECPVCMTFMYPPIYQCYNGHPICSTCKDKVDNTCPICRTGLGSIRNIALEKLAESIELPCKFHELGCQGAYSYPNRLRHEEDCGFRGFRPYNCPECSYTGDVPSLVGHLKETHSVKESDGSTFERRYIMSNFNEIKSPLIWHIWINNCFGHQFYIQFEFFILENAPVFMAYLRFMGEETEAENFRYCLEVGGKERLMTWQGIPRSIRDSDMVVRDSLDGLIIQKKILALFLTGDDGTDFYVAGRIWRKENN